LCVEHSPPILCRKHQVVEQNGNVVTFVDVLTPAFILRRRAAGNRPKEIEYLLNPHEFDQTELEAA
jgi:hypothetical protein